MSFLINPHRFGGGVTEADIAALSPVAWYDPSDLDVMWTDTGKTTNVVSDGDTVAVFEDKDSTAAYEMTQATASDRPVYKTSGGYHWIEATSASTKHMLTGSLSTPIANGPCSFACAFRAADSNAYRQPFFEENPSTAYARVGIIADTRTSPTRFCISTPPASGDVYLNNDVSFSTGVDRVSIMTLDGSEMRGWIDGDESATDSPVAETRAFGAVNTRLAFFREVYATRQMIGRIYGAIAFDYELSDTEVATVNTYLASKHP